VGGQAQAALARPSSPAPPSIYSHPGGGGGAAGGRAGTAGEPVPLDTPDPKYREYMEQVKQRIYAKWGYPYEAQTRRLQGTLLIEFHIAKDGHIEFIQLRQTSGEVILDSFAMTAVKLAQRYPPLPDAMQRDILPVVATFVYSLQSSVSILQLLR
jgi:TonB family protein